MQPNLRPNLARQGKVDVRRDEDQNIKLSQTIKLLIDAGYFRARVKGLSPFDKIVGGMTWCIEVCNFDVDVDLLFHDSLTIGQKISLTERIVKVLPYMKCPYSIEPHQIQGLDAIHIFPVVQWLVTQALETRVEYQDETRIIALNEFNRHYEYCFYHPQREEKLRRIRYIRDIKLTYGPKRRFKRSEQIQPEEELARPMMTLLEYSEAPEMPQLHADSDTESIDEEDEEVRNKLREKMSADVGYSARPRSYAVSSNVENQVKNIATATENYLRLKENESSPSSKDLFTAMERKMNEIEREKDAKMKALNDRNVKENELKLNVKSVQDQLLDISNETKNCESVYLAQKEETLETLSQLLEANEEAKKAASLFKEKCRREADEMRKLTSEIKVELEKEDAPLHESLLESRAFAMKRLKKVKELVAAKTREIEVLKRLIDDVPGRAELSQYQKRFIELFSLVGAEHHETLQFYNMYNSLADSRSYMEKESDLLNSTLDNMDQGLASSSSLDEYINQLKGIIDGIMQNKLKLDNKRSEARTERATLSTELNRLQDLQLHYVKVLHMFSQEIANNEILLEKIER